MLNREKYKEELEEILANEIAVSKSGEMYRCSDRGTCKDCIFCDIPCFDGAKAWLNSEYKEHILTEEEKEYLKAVIKPFRDRVEYIEKCKVSEEMEQIFIFIKEYIKKNEILCGYGLPPFKIGTMYKGMELKRNYELEELGL